MITPITPATEENDRHVQPIPRTRAGHREWLLLASAHTHRGRLPSVLRQVRHAGFTVRRHTCRRLAATVPPVRTAVVLPTARVRAHRLAARTTRQALRVRLSGSHPHARQELPLRRTPYGYSDRKDSHDSIRTQSVLCSRFR